MTELDQTHSNSSEERAGRNAQPSTRNPQLVWPVCLGLALVVLLVFLPVTRHDFVNYDDLEYVTQNSHVQAGLTWDSVTWAFRSTQASNWHPLTWLSHMLDCQLYGLKAGGHHLTNLLFHLANTLLVFLVLRRMTGALWRSAFVAALFGLHPLHVESVAWVAERKDVLSTLFWLLTLWAYTRYVEKCEVRSAKCEVNTSSSRNTQHATQITTFGSRAAQSGTLYYSFALVFFMLGLMAKPMLVTLPFVLLLLDYWPLGRFKVETANRRNGETATLPFLRFSVSPVRSLIWDKLPFFALALASSVVTFYVQRKGGAVSSLDVLPLVSRFANALVSYARYLGKTFWPDDLSVLYPHPGHWPAWQIVAAGMLLVIGTAGSLAMARRRPYLVVGWLWFVGTLVPVIGLVQVGIQSMADRYMYVPAIGVFVILAWGSWELMALWRNQRAALAVAGALVLVCCGAVTRSQIGYWSNSEMLFRRAVKVTRNNYLAYNNLGFYLSGQGRVEEAIAQYKLSLQINPNYEDAQNNLGYALAGQGKNAEAVPHYLAALRVKPNHVEVHNNLGNALAGLGKVDEAIVHYLTALRQNPDHADAHNNLGIALAMKGQPDEAIHHLKEAIRLKPKDASAHSNLGNALAIQRKFDEAIEQYLISLRMKPDESQTHNNLANALVEKGRLDEAIRHYSEAVKLNPKNHETHFNLGIALVRQQKSKEAAAHFSEALRLKPDYVEAQRQLDALSAAPQP